MLSKIARYIGLTGLVMGGVTFLAWITSPAPKFNPASFEDAPFESQLAAPIFGYEWGNRHDYGHRL